MIYLATPNTQAVREKIAQGRLGAMLTPDSWKKINEPSSKRFPWVGLDNGCFSEKWDEGEWKEWLVEMGPRKPECLFAVVPDVVADHQATLDRWDRYAGIVKENGYPAAFVLQDGCTGDLPWGEVDAIFVGGTTEYKLSEQAWSLVARARRMGIWTHMGRVNSFNRIRRAAAAGVDSVDGTYLRWPDTNLPKLLAWLDWVDHNQHLELTHV